MQIAIKELLEFNQWANEEYLKILETLSKDQMEKILEGFDQSLSSILFHIYEASLFWLNFMQDKEFVPIENISRDYKYLIPKLRGIDQETINYADSSNLMGKHRLQWNKDDKSVETNKERILFNFVTHAAYHRGQFAALLRHWNIVDSLTETDYNPYYYKLMQK